MNIRTILNYIKKFFEEAEGKPSSKKINGTILILSGIGIACYGVSRRIEHLDAVTGIVGVILGAGLTCLGLSSWQSVQSKKIDSGQASNNAVNIDNVENVSVDTKANK